MEIFVSWSGTLSHLIAIELKNWLPQIINQLNPFVSSEDIDKGNKWSNEIASKLNQTDFGIICLTRENLNSPWVLFEAGALSKNIERAKVCCVLFDNLSQNEVKPPLSLFQTTKFEKDDFRKLIFSINESLTNTKLPDALLNRSFDKWWPDLNEKIDKITQKYFPQQSNQTNNDPIKQILETTQYISKVVSRYNFNLPPESLDFARYDSNEEITFTGLNNNHPVRVIISPVPKGDGTICKLEINSKGINESEAIIDTRGVFIEILFYSEQGIFWKTYFHFHKGDTYLHTEKVILNEGDTLKYFGETIWRD